MGATLQYRKVLGKSPERAKGLVRAATDDSCDRMALERAAKADNIAHFVQSVSPRRKVICRRATTTSLESPAHDAPVMRVRSNTSPAFFNNNANEQLKHLCDSFKL